MSDAEQSQEDYKALYEETQKKLETVAAHKDKLYQETKKAKADREAAESERQRIERENAQKNGEFEKLWQQEAKEKEEALKSLQQLKKGYRQEKIDVTSMRIANELADGDNAELLSNFVKNTLDGLADETGSLSEDVLKSVVNEYKNNQKFKALLRMSKASGGGAPGNLRGAGESLEMKRADFDKLSADKQYDFIAKVRKGSAKLID